VASAATTRAVTAGSEEVAGMIPATPTLAPLARARAAIRGPG
jgi:hypothetical protein